MKKQYHANSWNFGNDFAKNVIIFDADNSSSSHANNCKNNLFMLSEGLTHGINESFGSPEKKLVLILLKQTQILVEFSLYCWY